jgi:cell division protein FtsQ
MLQSIDKKNRIVIYILILFLLSTISNKSNESKKNFNNINSIDVSGLSKNNNLKITDKLNQSLYKSIFFLKKEDIKKILSKYNLIESYTVKKIYPSEVKVEIEQTNFVAKIPGVKNLLIGENGKIIENETHKEHLPLFFGKFSSKKFLEFRKIIENSKFEFSDFESIFFYQYNRWDVLTKNKVLIKLPEKNLSETLKIAHKIMIDNQFQDISLIDLRIENHVVTKNE